FSLSNRILMYLIRSQSADRSLGNLYKELFEQLRIILPEIVAQEDVGTRGDLKASAEQVPAPTGLVGGNRQFFEQFQNGGQEPKKESKPKETKEFVEN